MTRLYYKLDGHKVVPCESVMEWAEWFEHNKERHVAQTTIKGVDISTVFLGLDHNWTSKGAPVIFETMIFGGEHD